MRRAWARARRAPWGWWRQAELQALSKRGLTPSCHVLQGGGVLAPPSQSAPLKLHVRVADCKLSLAWGRVSCARVARPALAITRHARAHTRAPHGPGVESWTTGPHPVVWQEPGGRPQAGGESLCGAQCGRWLLHSGALAQGQAVAPTWGCGSTHLPGMGMGMPPMLRAIDYRGAGASCRAGAGRTANI